MKRWDNPLYQKINNVDLCNDHVKITFENNDVVSLSKTSLIPVGYQNIAWDELSFTPFELIIPSTPAKIEVMWDSIRVMTDTEFSQFLATKAEEEAKKIGQKIKALRERKGIRANDLAEKAGITAQTISRIENGHTDVGFGTLKKILVSMGYGLKDLANEEIGEVIEEKSFHKLLRRLSKIGVDANLLTNKIIPKNIQEALTGYRDKEPELLLKEATSYISAIYGWSNDEIWNSPNLLVRPEPAELAFFKKQKNANHTQIKAYSHYAYYLAKIGLKGFPNRHIEYPENIEQFKEIYFKKYKTLNLVSLLEFVWDLGICVLPLCDVGVFHGASWNIDGRHVIILKQKTESHAKWIFDLLHELYHIFAHLDAENTAVIESEEINPLSDNDSAEELEANAFANQVIFGNRAEEIAEKCVSSANWDLRNLSKAIKNISKIEGISEDFIANYLAFRLNLQGENWWASANKLQITSPRPFDIAVKFVKEKINIQNLSPIDNNLLSSAILNF